MYGCNEFSFCSLLLKNLVIFLKYLNPLFFLKRLDTAVNLWESQLHYFKMGIYGKVNFGIHWTMTPNKILHILYNYHTFLQSPYLTGVTFCKLILLINDVRIYVFQKIHCASDFFDIRNSRLFLE